jgi:hypothetical protein
MKSIPDELFECMALLLLHVRQGEDAWSMWTFTFRDIQEAHPEVLAVVADWFRDRHGCTPPWLVRVDRGRRGCSTCHGEGWLDREALEGEVKIQRCPDCEGSADCEGSGAR